MSNQSNPKKVGETLSIGLKTEGIISIKTGALTIEEIEAMLDTLPVEITFVDKDDRVQYFNQNKGRIFDRPESIIGHKVQQCHSTKNIDLINRILTAFKKGSRDVAEFWMNHEGRLIHIRYIAVIDKNGQYMGCLEFTQDITNIKEIEGEKRLLNWTKS